MRCVWGGLFERCLSCWCLRLRARVLSCPCIARVFSPLGQGCNTGLSVQCGVDVSAINRLRGGKSAPAAATAPWQHPRVLQLWQYPHLELSDVVEVATLPTDTTGSPPSPSSGICGGAEASGSPGLYSCSVQLRTQPSGADHRDQRAAADTAVVVADALALWLDLDYGAAAAAPRCPSETDGAGGPPAPGRPPCLLDGAARHQSVAVVALPRPITLTADAGGDTTATRRTLHLRIDWDAGIALEAELLVGPERHVTEQHVTGGKTSSWAAGPR